MKCYDIEITEEPIKKVYLIEIEKELSGERITLEKINNTENIEVITNAKTKEIYGDDCVEGLNILT